MVFHYLSDEWKSLLIWSFVPAKLYFHENNYKDLVNDTEALLKKYNAPSDFYSNIDSLIFGVTDSFIIIMKEKGYGKIFIDNKNIKDYINKEHYLAYLFN